MTHLKRLIALFILVLSTMLVLPIAKASSGSDDNCPGYNDVSVEKITDVNAYSDYTSSTVYLDEYASKDYQKYSGGVYDVHEELEKIIPKDMLRLRGTYIHAGLKYGFFVQTQKADYCDVYDKWEQNVIEVFLFKVDRKLTFINGNISTSTTVTPILQNNFIYYYNNTDTVDTKIPTDKPLAPGDYIISPQVSSDNICINYAMNTINAKNGNAVMDRSTMKAKYKCLVDNEELYLLEGAIDTVKSLIFIAGLVMGYATGWYDFFADLAELGCDVYELFMDAKICSCSNAGELSISVIDDLNGLLISKLDKKWLNYVDLVKDSIILLFKAIDIVSEVMQDGISQKKLEKVFELVHEMRENAWDYAVESIDFDPIQKAATAYKYVKGIFFNAIKAVVNFFKSKYCSYDYYESTYEKKAYFGSGGSLDYKLCSTYKLNKKKKETSLVFSREGKMDVNKSDVINSSLYLQFYDGGCGLIREYCFNNGEITDDRIIEPQFYEFTSSYDFNIGKIMLDSPVKDANGNVAKAVNKNVLITDGSNSYKMYIKPTVAGIYRITPYVTARSQKIPFSVYKVRKEGSNVYSEILDVQTSDLNSVYEIVVDGTIYSDYDGVPNYNNGCHFMDVEVELVSINYYKRSASYDCKSTGFYQIEINTYYIAQRQHELYINSAYYRQLYRYSSYSYYRTYNVSCTKLTKNTYKIYMEKGATYYFDFLCSGDYSLKFVSL